MREELRKINNIRSSFVGTFERTGVKIDFGHEKRTVLLKDVKGIDGKVVADHIWFNLTKGFSELCLTPGDVVRFDARVKPYQKGYKGHREDVCKPIEIDYKLSHPTRMEKL